MCVSYMTWASEHAQVTSRARRHCASMVSRRIALNLARWAMHRWVVDGCRYVCVSTLVCWAAARKCSMCASFVYRLCPDRQKINCWMLSCFALFCALTKEGCSWVKFKCSIAVILPYTSIRLQRVPFMTKLVLAAVKKSR